MLFKRAAANAKAIAAIQSDYEQTFATAAGQRVFADMALMWGFLGGNMEGMRPELRDAFIWILDRMGKNHIDNLDDIARAVLQVNRVIPTQDELEPGVDMMTARFEQSRVEEEIGSWRKTSK